MGTGGSGDYLRNSDVTTSTAVGLPIGAFYGYKAMAFQNATELAAYPHRSDAGVGDVRYVDVSGDNELTDADRTGISVRQSRKVTMVLAERSHTRALYRPPIFRDNTETKF